MTSQPPPSLEHALEALRLLPRLHRWAAASVRAHHWDQGLSLRQLGVLGALRDGVTSPGQMARRLLVTPAVVTGLVDRLERQGYVRREAQAGDRRRLRLVLTPAGLAVTRNVQQALARELAAQLEGSAEEARALGFALERLARALDVLEARAGPVPDLAEDSDPEAPPAPRTSRRKRPRAASRSRTAEPVSAPGRGKAPLRER